MRPEKMWDNEDYVVAELVDHVKTPSDIQAEIQLLGTLNDLKAKAIRQERELNHLRSIRVKAMQELDVSLELTGTAVERLLEAGKAATIISQSMPPEAATMFITAVVKTAMQL
jgi:hypothetical protein